MANPKIREVFYTSEFRSFLLSVEARVREKYIWTIDVVETLPIIPAKYVKKLETVDLYEMRVSTGHNEYRTILFAMDSDNVVTATKIYLLNSFLKKSSKDYKREFGKAQKMLEEIA
jgi:phage-related protein